MCMFVRLERARLNLTRAKAIGCLMPSIILVRSKSHPNNARYRGIDLRKVAIGRRDLSQCGAQTTNLGTEQAQKLERLFKSNERERFEKFVEILFQLHIQFSSDDLGRGERIAVLFDRIADLMLDQGHYGELERLICKLRTLAQIRSQRCRGDETVN